MIEAIEVVLPVPHPAYIPPYFSKKVKKLFTLPRKKKVPRGEEGEERLHSYEAHPAEQSLPADPARSNQNHGQLPRDSMHQ